MKTKTRTTSYVFTADPLSVSDMQQIDMVRKTVRVQNKLVMENYGHQVRNAEYFGRPKPPKPLLYRVRLLGRGPRKAAYLENLREGGYEVSGGYRAYLPQRFATSFDVYIARRD
jgi:hypothetical protein